MSVYPHNYNNSARIYQDDSGLLWVSHQELLDNDYYNLEDFDIIYVNGKFYELQGYKTKTDEWWVEEVEVGDSVALPETPPE